MDTPHGSATTNRTALFLAIALLALSTAAHAQNITVTGWTDSGPDAANIMLVTSDQGFFGSEGMTFEYSYLGLNNCHTTPNNCTPGKTESLGATSSDATAYPIYNGVTYEANCIECRATFPFNFSGSFVLPPLAPTATVSARFTFSGSFDTGSGTSLALSGAGTATIAMHQSTLAESPDSWVIDRVTEWFDSPLPQPWLATDVGATGLYGSTAYNASDGTWGVAGAGADIWGGTDAFRFVFTEPQGNELVARVDAEDNTSPFAKAGIMFRSGVGNGAAHVLLDVRPDGSLEFMTRSQQDGATTFLATAQLTFPVWLKLSVDQGVTASVSEDGTAWQTLGVASNPFISSAPLGGLIVTSHDTTVLNHAVFSHVSETTHATAFPSPWSDVDVGAVGQAGSASYDQNSDAFTVTGAGPDIWGAADAFNYLYGPLAGDGSITATVTGEQNTNPFAKAGLVMRTTTDPGSPSVIIDCLPDGTIEFMARTAAGGDTTFIASSAAAAFPRTISLTRQGSTVTGSVYINGAMTTLGSIMLPDFASSGVLAEMAVTSHDTSVTNAATFVHAAIRAAASALPIGWSSQDVGAPGLGGSASYSSSTQQFTIEGAGADIWGTADAFQYVYQGASTGEQITARVVSEDAASEFAKAGVMYRGGLAPSAAFVMLDVKPDGGLEFMVRPSDGAAVQYLSGTSVGFGVFLGLKQSGGTMVASYSTDSGSTWTTIGTVSPTFSSPAVLGMIVCSHDPNALNTAVIDSVRLSPSD